MDLGLIAVYSDKEPATLSHALFPLVPLAKIQESEDSATVSVPFV